MRDLYRFAANDQTEPGRLLSFLNNTAGIKYDSAKQVWIVDLVNYE